MAFGHNCMDSRLERIKMHIFNLGVLLWVSAETYIQHELGMK
jgi:hypothetical protein